MKLTVPRFWRGEHATIGQLRIDGRFACFTLEDAARLEKIPGETRVPAGLYLLGLQTSGRLHAEYARRFSWFHRGMLALQDVPGFTGVMLHIGNTDADTEGCILVGDAADISDRGRVDHSASAYARIYPPIAAALEGDELVGIQIVDEEAA